MTFGPDHYVPVLKVKRGEKAALQAIPTPLRAYITPLLEIVERKPEKTIDAHLVTAFKDLQETTRIYSRCLIDARELEAEGVAAARAVFHRASVDRIIFTPVTGISRTADVAAALDHSDNGIAIRLTRREFEAGALPRGLSRFMINHKLDPARVDLIIDLGPVDNMIQEGVSDLATSFLSVVPDQRVWRTLTLSACAFPMSMGGVERDSHDLAERNEWRVWRDRLHTNRRALVRLPSYSDCGIQHTKGVEGFDPRTMQASAAIRYTLQEDWLLIKGVGVRSRPPSQQFPRLAKQLVYGRLSTHFAGPSHCSGCLGVKDAADGAAGFGALEAWRRLGTIHHITTVVRALTALPWP